MIEELKIQKQNSLQHTKVIFNRKMTGWGQFDPPYGVLKIVSSKERVKP